ncbi:MAG: hypothetical protein HGB34_03220 [Candidatus Moranbacteria bacterium]|nr:hypothetical protein [Candidatus Moranbacteria bacterium]
MPGKIGVLIYTYNRTDDAKINMEIIRNEWARLDRFKDCVIVHSFNGEPEWHPEPYLEDSLVRSENSWHFQGASDLIDFGFEEFKKQYHDVSHIVVLAADTWMVRPEYVEGIIHEMEHGQFVLSSCPWGIGEHNNPEKIGIAADFFVVDFQWARESSFFPIKYSQFFEKYGELLLYRNAGNIMLEKLVYTRYLQALSRQENMPGFPKRVSRERFLSMKERMPIHSEILDKGDWRRTMYWPEIGLLTHHDPYEKKLILRTLDIRGGESLERLLGSDDLGYYNRGVTKDRNSSN